MGSVIQHLTNDPNLTNAVATVASAIIALAALVVSIVSLFVAYRTIAIQHNHNVLSVRPLPFVSVADFYDRQTVKLFNNGTGPMIVKGVCVTDGSVTKDAIIDCMPELSGNLLWTNFCGPLSQRSVPANGDVMMLELSDTTTNADYVSSREACRKRLSSLTVNVEYTDIYDTQFAVYAKSLTWFGRHYGPAKAGADGTA